MESALIVVIIHKVGRTIVVSLARDVISVRRAVDIERRSWVRSGLGISKVVTGADCENI